MLVLAISRKNAPFWYNAKTARRVSARSAETIKKIVNEYNYLLHDDEMWFLHEVDKYDTAYDYAQFAAFTIRKGIVKDCRY